MIRPSRPAELEYSPLDFVSFRVGDRITVNGRLYRVLQPARSPVDNLHVEDIERGSRHIIYREEGEQ